MGKFVDLTDQEFERLKVIKRVPKPDNRKNKGVYWLCKCNCGSGKEIIASTGELKSGNTKSCGCLNIEKIIQRNKINKKKYNTYDLSGEYGIGYTKEGKIFYFDLEDYDKIKNYYWYIDNKGYVMNAIDENNKMGFHRLVMNCNDNDEVVDHINGRKTRNDNRKYNLRICTYQQNSCNRNISINNTSGCTGVTYVKKQGKWRASIQVNKIKINLGLFEEINNAIEARKNAEIKYFGEFRWKGENNVY